MRERDLQFLVNPSDYVDTGLAVVDPPSYSTTRMNNRHFDIAKDYPFLLNQVFKLMRPASTIFFSTNHQNFPWMKTSLMPMILKRSPGRRFWRIMFPRKNKFTDAGGSLAGDIN